MKVTVNKERCIGCGACVATIPEVFDFNDEGFACVKSEDIPEEKKEEVKEMVDMCVGGAITTIDE